MTSADEPTLHAQLCELLGYDPDDPRVAHHAEELARREDAGAVAARLAPGSLAPARAGDHLLVVARLADGTLCALEDRCPHGQSHLSDGWLDGDAIRCARHGWATLARTGACTRAEKVYQIRTFDLPADPPADPPERPCDASAPRPPTPRDHTILDPADPGQ